MRTFHGAFCCLFLAVFSTFPANKLCVCVCKFPATFPGESCPAAASRLMQQRISLATIRKRCADVTARSRRGDRPLSLKTVSERERARSVRYIVCSCQSFSLSLLVSLAELVDKQMLLPLRFLLIAITRCDLHTHTHSRTNNFSCVSVPMSTHRKA